MRRVRFTIAGLLGVTLFLGVAFAALREADHQWDGGVLSATLVVLLTSVLLAVHRTEGRRAFWLGFALFGWFYLAASLFPPVAWRLPTTKGLVYLDAKLPGRSNQDVVLDLATVNTGQNGQAVPSGRSYVLYSTLVSGSPWDVAWLGGPGSPSENFVRIGHSFLALILGYLGGFLSRLLFLKGRPRDEDGPAPSPVP